ncbi:MAG: CRISPR-associated endonuclease Cas6 [Thermodesulfobacteriota bacterium]|nr:CRISPR-associated endonuclease Cas6 [Thermodesulfobacteriota bacterium]
MNNKMKHCILKLKLNRPINQNVKAKDLRGAIANLYPEKQLLHQHCENGKIDYHHPLVQYKIINGECLLVGFKDGAELLANLALAAKTLFLGCENYTILTTELEFHNVSIKTTETVQRYSFLTPWLALNEKNYEKYQRFGSWPKRKELLEKVLIGNIISMSKGLGYTVPAPIKVNNLNLKETQTSLKSTLILGFLGTFSINFEIPDYWGIGKSVSRGFGTIRRCQYR